VLSQAQAISSGFSPFGAEWICWKVPAPGRLILHEALCETPLFLVVENGLPPNDA
jgi:hypothetical protein